MQITKYLIKIKNDWNELSTGLKVGIGIILIWFIFIMLIIVRM